MGFVRNLLGNDVREGRKSLSKIDKEIDKLHKAIGESAVKKEDISGQLYGLGALKKERKGKAAGLKMAKIKSTATRGVVALPVSAYGLNRLEKSQDNGGE